MKAQERATSHLPMYDIGVVRIIAATIATLWNYVYNFDIDQIMQRLWRDIRKTTLIRVLHAVVFEVGLLRILLPLFP
jgi:uncharacterized membrane protein